MKKIFSIILLASFTLTISQTKPKKPPYSLSTPENSFRTLCALLIKNDTTAIKKIVIFNGYKNLEVHNIIKNAPFWGKFWSKQITNKNIKVSLLLQDASRTAKTVHMQKLLTDRDLTFIKMADSSEYKFFDFLSIE